MSLDFEEISPFDPEDLQVPRAAIIKAGRESGRRAPDSTYQGIGITNMIILDDVHAPE